MNARSRSRFSLREVTLGMSLLGVFLAMVSIRSTGGEKIDVAADLISQKIMIARQKAIAAKTRYRVQISYSDRRLQVQREVSPGVWKSDPPNVYYDLPRGIHISSTSTPIDGTIDIRPSGTIEHNDLPVIIKLKDKSNTLRSVQVTRAGFVSESSLWD